MHVATLCVANAMRAEGVASQRDAERPDVRSHAERGYEEQYTVIERLIMTRSHAPRGNARGDALRRERDASGGCGQPTGRRTSGRAFPRGAWVRGAIYGNREINYDSFPRSAWECTWRRSASRTRCERRVWPANGTQSVRTCVPTRSVGTRSN